MSNQTLTFQNITLSPVTQNDGQIWLTASDLSKALGYAEVDSVTKIFNRNSDEFSENMSQVVEIPLDGQFDRLEKGKNLVKKIRIFSLRGCHLIAMFSRTKIAKAFRVWVLDILDKEVGEPKISKTTTDERTPLRQAVTALVGKAKIMHDEAYSMVNQYMGVNHIWEIPKEDLPRAVTYVHSLMLITSQPMQAPTHSTLSEADKTNLTALVCHTFNMARWYKKVSEPIRLLNRDLQVESIEAFWTAERVASGLNSQFNLGVDMNRLLAK